MTTETKLKVGFLVLVIAMAFVLATGCSPGVRVVNDGPKGDQGLPGVAPVVTVTPAALSDCPTGGLEISVDNAVSYVCNGAVGPTGASGAPGVAGVAGPQGNPGNNGLNGSNGTSVTIVQFCPGTTVYPSKFNEIGFCIGGDLYGTYSANDGFSSYLPPGAYSSDGINSSCNFTIGPNCTISH